TGRERGVLRAADGRRPVSRPERDADGHRRGGAPGGAHHPPRRRDGLSLRRRPPHQRLPGPAHSLTAARGVGVDAANRQHTARHVGRGAQGGSRRRSPSPLLALLAAACLVAGCRPAASPAAAPGPTAPAPPPAAVAAPAATAVPAAPTRIRYA